MTFYIYYSDTRKRVPDLLGMDLFWIFRFHSGKQCTSILSRVFPAPNATVHGACPVHEVGGSSSGGIWGPPAEGRHRAALPAPTHSSPQHTPPTPYAWIERERRKINDYRLALNSCCVDGWLASAGMGLPRGEQLAYVVVIVGVVVVGLKLIVPVCWFAGARSPALSQQQAGLMHNKKSRNHWNLLIVCSRCQWVVVVCAGWRWSRRPPRRHRD